MADIVRYLDALAAFFQTKAFAGYYLLIAFGVKVGKAFGEFHFFTIHFKGTVGGGFAGDGRSRKVVAVYREEPFHVGLLKFEDAGSLMRGAGMHFKAVHGAEDPTEHIEEMNTDVCCKAAGLFLIPFPGVKIPVAAGGNVGQVYLVAFAPPRGFYLVVQGFDNRVKPELQDSVNPLAGLFFNSFQRVQVPGI